MEDAWAQKLPKFKKGHMTSHLLEESSFICMFPRYREEYIKQSLPLLTKKMNQQGIKTELDLIEGTLKVSTTKNTWDPYAIIKARDIIKLVSRCVPIEHAVRVMDDDKSCIIINISGMVSNRARFVNRRQRLIGTNGTTLKALELLTDCYIMVQGGTVAAVGPYKGIPKVEEVVNSTMRNIHPIYLLKRLMIQKQLANDPKLKNEDWSRFLPNFKPKNVQTKKPKKIKKKGPYTPFPPEQTERKQDQEISEGKFFLDKEGERKGKKKSGKNEVEKEEYQREEDGKGEWKKKKEKKLTRREEKRAMAYQAPEEPAYQPNTGKRSEDVDISALKKKLVNKKRKRSA